MIDKIQRVKLRDVWPHEATSFTVWLENNIDVVNECVGLNLGSVRREKNAGDFNVDLVAEDESGNLVIIENQLEKSNHDHLGKLITYLTVLEAKGAIWIVSEPRPEHVRAIAWLNESRAAAFYLVKVEAIRIGNSPAAPLLPHPLHREYWRLARRRKMAAGTRSVGWGNDSFGESAASTPEEPLRVLIP
jgi:hypothetical protein